MATLNRQTVDLSDHPDLVIIRVGMRAESVKGFLKLMKYGYQIIESVNATDDSDSLTPEGLLHHEESIFSLFPPHLVIRQYWHNFDSLEEWTRSSPHRELWQELIENPAGTTFWHELYSQDGIEAIYHGLEDRPMGMMNFAPTEPARGNLFSARKRLQRSDGSDAASPPLSEEDIYDDESE